MSARVGHDVGVAAQAGVGQRGVDGTDREDRRDRQPRLERRAPATAACERLVRDDEHLDARSATRPGPRSRAARPRPRGRRVRRRDPTVARSRLIAMAPAGLATAQRPLEAVEVGHERRRQPQRPGLARDRAEQLRAAPELHREVHDDALALGVDGRVRDLRERLAQVVGDRAGPSGEAGGGGVVAHRPQRLVRLEGHRLDVEPLALRVDACDPALARAACLVGRDGRHLGRRASATMAGAGRHITTALRLARRVVDGSPARSYPRGTSRRAPGVAAPACRRRSIGTAPPSDAATTMPSRETVTASGRRPLRSRMAPTRRPSLKQSAAGPSHGRDEAARARRGSASSSGSAVECAARAPRRSRARSAASSRQPDATRRSSASSSESESEPPGCSERGMSPRGRRRAVPPSRARRPRSSSRPPRTVLTSPLWREEAERLRERPGRDACSSRSAGGRRHG